MTKLTHKLPMGDPLPGDIAEWKMPDQVMQLHRLKLKKRALQARMNRTSIQKVPSSIDLTSSLTSIDGSVNPVSQKRKNPFARDTTFKKHKTNPITTQELEASSDTTLFELLNIQKSKNKAAHGEDTYTFTSVLSKLENGYVEEPGPPKGANYIPVDWTLNTKMRFMSPKPFAWNGKLKTTEEASATTGFVRCLDIGEEETTLDTSPNARFHRCCLVWQHPSLPWIELFPRSAGKMSAAMMSGPMAATNQYVKDALHRDWSESFRSLFQLVRARQCPYFYVCANTFTVLFRAAGICGLSQVHALLTPTTRGFRQILKQADIVFTMPLKKESKRRSDTTDSGCDTLDSSVSNMTNPSSKEEHLNEDDDDEDAPAEKWLQSLGVEASEIRKINSSQARLNQEKESELDNTRESLIFVQDVEAQALFNFLINCKSAVAVTGAMAGIPPTLLAPTAFHGATLKPLKVKESVVNVDNEKFYSLELRGPLLPHTLPSLCHLMTSSHLEKFSVSCAHVDSTTSFSLARHGQDGGEAAEPKDPAKAPPSVFGQENLSDCGFGPKLLKHFCSPDPTRILVLESLKFSNDGYIWS
ncbi:protein downstream neighbor of son homolog [Athalia rosae]|uniref:protein downstream neighbor of son homolog n=1 Tax=Athalia rosae TaxID=37344 RepID=UPI0020345EEC|nr:protein downstream neighbor of son homolog [Athalia rosae]XP_048509849.1 protein downstream neighbor of son homolog [Athalia rosae]XP_048509850.1 protein downstream neighbor of son homolog [Athalia rosae]XP_048509851.1 protein downstream neighbor of son homolog [Athalia rosae]XP_048509852.1 protein downstream neighbor of son homolog [Athalia rosae]XP_048509853.1 protein downstream neighbor of son homolog [Athalia rosae]XP_048509854.1 protein downstream neighbor of son homolog [Athalia rosa